MDDREMMAKIKAAMGQPIREAIVNTPFSESFIAALVANESSGDPAAKRFEPTVFVDLAQVLAGRKAAFGSLGAQDLTGILTRAGLNGNPLRSVTNTLMDLATSWGPTQIMGYQGLHLNITLDSLRTLPLHFVGCVKILKSFMQEWRNFFDVAGDQEKPGMLWRCWNTGEPEGTTRDPEYVAKAIFRKSIYEGLP